MCLIQNILKKNFYLIKKSNFKKHVSLNKIAKSSVHLLKISTHIKFINLDKTFKKTHLHTF